MKKLVSFILAIALLVALSLNVFAATPSDLFPGMTEIVVSEYYQAGV